MPLSLNQHIKNVNKLLTTLNKKNENCRHPLNSTKEKEAVKSLLQVSKLCFVLHGFSGLGFVIGQRHAHLNFKSVRFVVFKRNRAVAAANDAIDNC